jgi:CheY-like chemotaxis protein
MACESLWSIAVRCEGVAQVPKTILLVDDSSTMRVAQRIAISKLTNFNVVCASSGHEALEKAVSETPDLILMDVVMPDMDGFEVCRELRKNPRTMKLPIVLVTFRNGEESVQQGYQSGCSAYLMKPVKDGELRDVLNKYLG